MTYAMQPTEALEGQDSTSAATRHCSHPAFEKRSRTIDDPPREYASSGVITIRSAIPNCANLAKSIRTALPPPLLQEQSRRRLHSDLLIPLRRKSSRSGFFYGNSPGSANLSPGSGRGRQWQPRSSLRPSELDDLYRKISSSIQNVELVWLPIVWELLNLGEFTPYQSLIPRGAELVRSECQVVIAKASRLAEPQMWHQDNGKGGITLIIALEDIEGEAAGGTEILLGSHHITQRGYSAMNPQAPTRPREFLAPDLHVIATSPSTSMHNTCTPARPVPREQSSPDASSDRVVEPALHQLEGTSLPERPKPPTERNRLSWLRQVRRVVPVLKAGDVVVMDARTIHRGLPNRRTPRAIAAAVAKARCAQDGDSHDESDVWGSTGIACDTNERMVETSPSWLIETSPSWLPVASHQPPSEELQAAVAQASADILEAASSLQKATGLRWSDAWEPGDRPILVIRYDTADNKPPGYSMVWTLAVRSVIGPVLSWMAGEAPAGLVRGGDPGPQPESEYTASIGLTGTLSAKTKATGEHSCSPADGTPSPDSTDQGRN